MSRPECRTSERHHPDEPTGYVTWFVWAEEMSRTHVQRRCGGCGRFSLWVPREPSAVGTADAETKR